MKRFFTLLILLAIAGPALAQSSATKKADKHFDRLEFVDAAKDYLKIVERGNADDYVYTRLADSYYNVYQSKEAEMYYKRVINNNPSSETVFRYAQMLKANGKYQEADKYMNKFASMNPGDDRAIAFRNNPDYLPKILDQKEKFNVQNMTLNSKYSDFGGVRVGNKLYFSSSRNQNRRNYGWNEEPYLDIYVADIDENGSYTNERLLPGKVNTKYHEGQVAFSKDAKFMYFDRVDYYDGKYNKDTSQVGISQINIYRAELVNGEYADVQRTKQNNRQFSSQHPALSPDGKYMYFSSNRPGGYGGFDLYRAPVNVDGTMGEAVNLGQKVNTAGSEGTPFIGSDNTLYFASDGHLGLGGKDIFYTRMDGERFGPIRNVGVPVNSPADDIYFSFNKDTQEGLVSSNRAGGAGSDDIYFVKELQPMCDTQINAMVTDSNTGAAIAGATVTLLDDNNNRIGSKTTDAQGMAVFVTECDKDRMLRVVMDGYESGEEMIKGSQDEEVSVTVALTPIEEIIVQEEIIDLKNIYFEFDRSNITPQAAFVLDNAVQVMKRYPQMVVAIESHTDNRGSDSYNMRLSDRRAKTTAQYLISRGIEANRVSGQGYGESRPAVNCGGGCSESDHDQNRRSEFKIVNKGERM